MFWTKKVIPSIPPTNNFLSFPKENTVPEDIICMIFTRTTFDFNALMKMRGFSRAFKNGITPSILEKANAREFSPGLLEAAKAIVETFTSLMTALHIAESPSACAVQAGIHYIANILTLNGHWNVSTLWQGIDSMSKILGLDSGQRKALSTAYSKICKLQEANNPFPFIQCLLEVHSGPYYIFPILKQPNQIKLLNIDALTMLREKRYTSGTDREEVITDELIKNLSDTLVHPECRLRTLMLEGCIRIGTSIEHLSIALKNPACNLSTIYFGNNRLNDASLQSLAEALRNPNCNLTSVYITNECLSSALLPAKYSYENKFTKNGLKALAEAVFSQGCRTKIYIGSKQAEFDGYLRNLKEPQPDIYQFESFRF